MTFKPMLAASTIPHLNEIRYPVMASPKLDGIRCLIRDGVALSRSLKPIPNLHIQEHLADHAFNGLDGELMIPGKDFNQIQSAVMSRDGAPDFVYMAFDNWALSNVFEDRFGSIRTKFGDRMTSKIQIVEHRLISTSKELEAYWVDCVSAGYEGLILRDPKGPYKHGRSTLKQGWMLKLKHFMDAEGEILHVNALMRNMNDSLPDEMGQLRKSKHQDNLMAEDMVGSFTVKYNGHTFEVGSGLNEEQRRYYWAIKDALIGELLCFKYQELSKYGIPRFPVFKGMRASIDV